MRTTLTSLLTPLVTVAAVLATAGTAAAHDEAGETAAGHHPLPHGARPALAHLANDLRAYRDPSAAVAAGWIPTDTCVALPDGSAGMGYHYINPLRLVGAPDPARPAILVYVPSSRGKAAGRTLGAAEWFAADADQDLSTDGDRPDVLGIPFDGPMPGHEPGMPIHYDLHAWLFVHNPAGLMEPFNPAVRCP